MLDGLEKRYQQPFDDVWDASDFHCRRLGPDVYLLTYTLLQNRERKTRRSTIWQHSETGWKIVFHQGTIVQEALVARALMPAASALMPTLVFSTARYRNWAKTSTRVSCGSVEETPCTGIGSLRVSGCALSPSVGTSVDAQAGTSARATSLRDLIQLAFQQSYVLVFFGCQFLA